ncbi:hypothetical protein HB772_04975 [Sinorhizobium meliloti]|nr:hypothetical protein HB772_04975 [Sinorhizobium meliloti]
MAVQLEIRDGDPWWLSPDIWVVPGPDPLGASGLPIVGVEAFLWARVRNSGSTSVTNARVNFYWADPSVGFDRTTAHPIGTAFASVDPGASVEVLSLQPWIPEFVNDGHECVLAEAFHVPQDPLPATAAFNVPNDRHVAQRNLSVVQAFTSGFFRFTFSVWNTGRLDRRFDVRIETGNAAELKPLLPTLGPKFELPDLAGRLAGARFVEDRCADPEALAKGHEAEPGLAAPVPARRRINRTLVGRLEGGAALLHLVQREGERVVGGLSLVVLPGIEETKSSAQGAA